MKLSEYAKLKGVTYKTAWNWFNRGLIPGAVKMSNQTIIVELTTEVQRTSRVVIYCRVNNAARRKELDYQVDRVEQFCLAKGLQVDKVYKEVASGMNDNRKQLWSMIDSSPTCIVVENKDRLTRFGFMYLKNLLLKNGTEIIVVHNDATDEQDLVRDLVSIITSFCCRLYGLRRGKKKADKIKEQINDNT